MKNCLEKERFGIDEEVLVIKKKERGECWKVQRSCQVHAENGIIHAAEGAFVISSLHTPFRASSELTHNFPLGVKVESRSDILIIYTNL